MTIYFNFLSAKKSSDAKDAVILVDVETAKECPFAISFLAKQNGIDLSNYFKPVTTDTPIVDDLPEENEFSTTWCEKYELADDKKTWRLIAAPEPAPETNLTDQNDSSEVLTIVSAMPQLESRIASIFLHGVEELRLTREQVSQVIALKMDTDNKFFQDIILAVHSEPYVKGANMTQLGALINGIKEAFPQTDKPAELGMICNFVKQWCSCAVACSVDGHSNDEALANIVAIYRDKKNTPAPAIKTENADSPFKDASCGIPTIFYAMELDAALSLMGKNPADAKAADVGVAKVLIEKNDPKWRSIVSAFRTIVGITEVERETRHAIIQELLKNLKVIDDKTALLDFIKTRLANHPQCEELAGYTSSVEGEKPEVTGGKVVNMGGGKFDISQILENSSPATNDEALPVNEDLSINATLSPRAEKIKAALQSAINGETNLDSAEGIAATLQKSNVTAAYLLEWLPNEIELAELGSEVDNESIGSLMMDLFDVAPKFITDSSERVQFFTNQIAEYKKEWEEHEAECDREGKSAKPLKPTVEDLQAEIQALKANQALVGEFINAGIKLFIALSGAKS